jgi:hypothetical protein
MQAGCFLQNVWYRSPPHTPDPTAHIPVSMFALDIGFHLILSPLVVHMSIWTNDLFIWGNVDK